MLRGKRETGGNKVSGLNTVRCGWFSCHLVRGVLPPAPSRKTIATLRRLKRAYFHVRLLLGGVGAKRTGLVVAVIQT